MEIARLILERPEGERLEIPVLQGSSFDENWLSFGNVPNIILTPCPNQRGLKVEAWICVNAEDLSNVIYKQADVAFMSIR